MKSSKSRGKNNARTRRGLKPTSGGGAGVAGALGSLCEGGEEEQGGSEGLLEASRAGKGAGQVKKKSGWVKGRLR